MAKVTKKTVLKTIDGTPKKRFFLSIISDYDLKTGLCELIDNALDLWITNERQGNLEIEVTLDADRQFIQVKDNAGGVSEGQADLLISPGATRNDMGEALIGIFGVGGKRAAIALGEIVEIRTRHANDKSIQIDLTKDWVESPDWDLEIYEIPEIAQGTTSVDITKIRQGFDATDITQIRKHFAETYSWFIKAGCEIKVNKVPIKPITFDSWAYPPSYPPRTSTFTIEPADGQTLEVKLTAGLIIDRDPEGENYGAYFICNHRLIMKEVRTRDVGYFVSGESGVPHPDASLCRVMVEYYGAAELMPWTSSKSGINFSHPAFHQIRARIIEFGSYYTKLSRAWQGSWETEVYPHKRGQMEVVEPSEILSNKKKVLPRPPSFRRPSHIEELRTINAGVMANKPWTVGLIEAMGLVDLIGRQNYVTKNRAALILLDSNFEIAIKEYIIGNKKRFPPHIFTDNHIANIFKQRSAVINAIQPFAKFPQTLLNKVNYYYVLRNSLIHQRATVLITDDQVADYEATIERILKKLFGLQFPD